MPLILETGCTAIATDHPLSNTGAAPSFATTGLIDASGEKVAFVGYLWHPTVKTGTIKIRKVAFRAGTVGLNAASEIRVSLQDVSTTAGPPFQPDGTQDQFYDFKTATVPLASSVWQSTGALSADRTVDLSVYAPGAANSRRFAVVFEYQAFNASDTVTILGKTEILTYLQNMGVVLNTGSWAAIGSNGPIIAFECDDGSLAFFQSCLPMTATGSVSVGNAAAIRRAGVLFSVPTQRTLERVALSMRLPNGADGSIILYDTDGTTALRTIGIDNDDVRSATTDSYFEIPIEPVTLLAGGQYRLAYVASTSTTGTVYYIDVDSAALQDGLILGQSAVWTQHDGSVWTETTTRRPCFGVAFGSYGSGGMLVNSGMVGGIRG